MTDPNNLEPRLLEVERDIASANENAEQARGQAAAAFSLASGASREVADVRQQLRAHTGVLQALRQTQLDHHREFTDFRAESQATSARIEAKLTEVTVGQLHITHLLENLAGK